MKIDIRKFEEWSSLTEKRDTRSYYDLGDSDPRSLFEYILSDVDNNLNESLVSVDFNFNEIDNILAKAVVESILSENDEALNEVLDFVKKRIQKTIDTSKDLFNKGIQVGAELYTSVKEIGKNIKDAVSKVFEKVKKFLEVAWDWAKKEAAPALKKMKSFLSKEIKGTAVSSLATVLNQKSTEKELEELPKDLKSVVEKMSGVAYKFNFPEAETQLAYASRKLEDTPSDEVDDTVIKNVLDLGESTVHKIFTSIKGLLMEGHTIANLNDFLNEAEEEKHSTKKSLMGWLIEAVGFALNPFAKLYEYAIKATTNGVMIVTSSIARGGIEKAYKYVVLGTVASLTYHIIHGMENIAKEFTGEEEKGESLVEAEHLFSLDNAVKIFENSLGKVFTAALKSFLPVVGLIMEIVITAIATFELIIAFCELNTEHEEMAACKLVMKVEHGLEHAFS